jgi:hypothetical protein
MEFPGMAVFHFDRAHRAITAIPEPHVEEDRILDNYYRAALPMALQFFGLEVLHASAVCTRLGVVAFCAVSETGKSTTVAALSSRGYPVWADDAVPIETDKVDGGARALAVPFRLRADTVQSPSSFHWPEPGRLELRATALAALCVMQRVSSTNSVTEIRRLTAVEAVAALLPHAYCFTLADQGRKRAMVTRYIEIAARVPTYAVSIASGLERLPAVLDQIEGFITGFAPPAGA